MGDLNCNLLSKVVGNDYSYVLNIIDISGLTQLITNLTRVTQHSSTLIYLCQTNSPDKISKSGVINIGISDPSAIIDLSVIPTVDQISEKVIHDQTSMNENGLLNSGRHWRQTIACVSILIEVFLMV